MDESQENEDTPVAVQKFRTSITISSLGNERRVIQLGENDQDTIRGIIHSIDAAFGTVRNSQALTFTDSSGAVIFANLDNVAFVEVHVG